MNVEIIETIPSAVYQGRVHTQTVVMQLESEERLRVDDPVRKCGDRYISESAEVSISSDIAQSVEFTDADKTAIEPFDIERGAGIDVLNTEIIDVLEKQAEEWTAILAIPGGELKFTFNMPKLIEQVPDDYEPEIGDSLKLESISFITIDSIEFAGD